MSGQLWSWLLAGIGITGIALAGRARPAVGWAIGLTAQLLWVAYALATRQYGFLASAAGYGTVYALNVRRALTRRRRPARATTTTTTGSGSGATALAGTRLTRTTREDR